MFPECKKDINFEFIMKASPLFYRMKYLNHLADLIVQKETALLPASQEKAKNYKTFMYLTSKAKEIRAQIREINRDILELNAKLDILDIDKDDHLHTLEDFLHTHIDDVINGRAITRYRSEYSDYFRYAMRIYLNKYTKTSLLSNMQNLLDFWTNPDQTWEVLDEKICILKAAKKLLTIKKKKYEIKYRTYDPLLFSFGDSHQPLPVKQEFMFKCPYDDCKGYINGKKCGLCSKSVCSKCMSPMMNEHKCDKDNLATAKLIKSDSKPCPKCKTLIFKISGCYQMWCTQCHTTFHWRTEEIIYAGVIHNPHYTQWVAAHPEVKLVQDANHECGQLPNVVILNCFISPYGQDVRWYFSSLHRVIGHIRDVEYKRFIQTPEREYVQARIDYLVGEKTEKQWVMLIKHFEKTNNKNTLIMNILEMFVDTARLLLNNMFEEGTSSILSYRTQLIELVKYTVSELEVVVKILKIPDPNVLLKLRDLASVDGKNSYLNNLI